MSAVVTLTRLGFERPRSKERFHQGRYLQRGGERDLSLLICLPLLKSQPSIDRRQPTFARGQPALDRC
jgi:hypothetical protein